MKKALNWIFGCLFAWLAIFSLINAHFVSFLFEAFIALLLIPPANNSLKERFRVNLPKWITPTAISLYFVFIIVITSINLYKASAPYIQPFIRMSQEVTNFKRQPLERVTIKQKEAVEKYQIEITEFINKLKTLNQITSEERKKEKIIEYSEEIKNLKIPEGLPTEVESLLVASKQDFSTAFELAMKMDKVKQDDMIKMINIMVDGFIKVSKASILVGITPEQRN